MKKLLGLSLLIAVVITLVFPSLAGAHYTQKVCTIMGSVKVDGRAVPEGTEIIPWVPDVAPEIYERWKAETFSSHGVSGYICRVPDNNPDNPDKDGAYHTDDVRFYIRMGVVTLLADQSVNYWRALTSPGMMYLLNLTASYMSPPQLISPENGMKVMAPEIAFDWSDVIAPGVTYSLQVDQMADFSTPAINQTGLTNSSYGPVEFPLVEGAGVYFWRVEAVDGSGWKSGWSEVWAFTAPNIGYQNLEAGWNLITYKGDTLPTEKALAYLGDKLVVIWGWDAVHKKWCGYAPGGGFANDLLELVQYDPYWLYLSQGINLHYMMDP
jgi:hypothetical protein